MDAQQPPNTPASLKGPALLFPGAFDLSAFDTCLGLNYVVAHVNENKNSVCTFSAAPPTGRGGGVGENQTIRRLMQMFL